MAQRVVNLAESPDLSTQVSTLHRVGWPAFMLHDEVAGRHWRTLLTTFADSQIVILDETNTALAVGNAIPLVWDGTLDGLPVSWDAALEQGVRDRADGRIPTALCALAAVVAPSHRGKGLSPTVIGLMRSIAAKRGLSALIAPVRPTLKSRYPLTTMERYVQWRQADGLPFDPWLRVHRRLGAEYLCISPRSMVITGTVAEWQEWTGMQFPESGAYIVPGALQPVQMDCEQNLGRYEDPNVWMRHALA